MTLSAEERNRRLKRCCATCGKCMNSIIGRAKYCSQRCGFDAKKTAKKTAEKHKLVEVNCAVCQVPLERRESDLSIRSQFACSPRCQRVIAGWAGRDRVKASLKAKERWRKNNTKKRKVGSMGYAWWRLFNANVNRLFSKLNVLDSWDVKCTTAAQTVKNRESTQRKRRECKKSWNLTVSRAMDLLHSKTNARLKTGWDARCASAASSIAKRTKS